MNFYMGREFFKQTKRTFALMFFVLLLSVIVLYKLTYYANIEGVDFWAIYSLFAGLFLISRLLFAFLHDGIHLQLFQEETDGRKNFVFPSVSIVIAAKNEEKSIFKTIDTCLSSDYPSNLECIVIDDGSDDKTLSEMNRAVERFGNGKVVVKSFGENRGKREAMAEGVLLAKNDIIVFVDSDTFLERDALKKLIRPFSNPKIGAISGNTCVANREENILTKMQSIRYAISYDIFKSSESFYGVVTCCPGCFSAYRKEAISPILDQWRNQMFLGTKSTFGDDRSLTNYVLKNWKVIYTEHAKAKTLVPDKYEKFLKQQLRWKKSWIREGFVSASFMWRKHPIAALSFYVNLILPLLGPLVVGWVLYMTIFHFNIFFLLVFLTGIISMGLLFGIFLHLTRGEKYWLYMPLFSIFYTFVMIWQMPYAMITLKKTHWGTR